MIDQPGPPGATPKGESQGFVVDKNVKLTDPVALANADPSTGILTEPERLAKADPNVGPDGKNIDTIHTARSAYNTPRPDGGFRGILRKQLKELDKKNRWPEEIHATDLDEIMQKVTDPEILVKADEMYKARDGAVIKTVEDGLKELAKGGRVGEAKIPNIPVKPARADAPSRLTRAGWRTTQSKSQLTPRAVRDVFPASGKK